MQRVLVALLTALDALVAGAVGIAAALAPLALLWVFALPDPAWGDLWPASGVVWQLGHFVPVTVTLPGEYLAVSGIPPEAATFVLSLAPLAFALFTAWSAARSAGRAARAGAWFTGVVTGALVFGVIAAVVALTTRNPIAVVDLLPAILLPMLVYLVPALVAGIVTAWREGDGGVVDAVRDRIERMPGSWADVPALALRGLGVVVAGLAGVGALVVLFAVLLRGSEAIALFQTANVDGLGATVVALGQLVYLPTLVAWAVSFAAGPGFAIGADASVAPGSGQVGVVPGIPVLALAPPDASSWYLLLVLLPIGVGALAGWVLRARTGDEVAPRVVLVLAVAVLSAGFAALLALASSGSMGPGQLAHAGPAPGPLALAVGIEVALGCGILLLSPRPRVRAEAPAPAAEDALAPRVH
ncbi:DUF6350 family protein [Microbacterium sp. X-17]|uniref:cell division protein PerM n=1 Tax=Microbacterium sp. X-17 TaxID=3144404 RepID=UPI0031F541E5